MRPHPREEGRIKTVSRSACYAWRRTTKIKFVNIRNVSIQTPLIKERHTWLQGALRPQLRRLTLPPRDRRLMCLFNGRMPLEVRIAPTPFSVCLLRALTALSSSYNYTIRLSFEYNSTALDHSTLESTCSGLLHCGLDK